MQSAAWLALILAAGQSQPASGPGGPVAFQPGVSIDWQQSAVYVRARVILRRGPLEFLACWSGKEHESILRFEATPEALYMALGLVGVRPGYPVRWNDETEMYDPPTGGLVNVSLEWTVAGRRHTVDSFEWLRETDYGRVGLSRPWVFAGSLRREDDRLACGESGVGVALVDFPDSLVCLTRRHPSSYGDLWAEANTERIPPLETPVEVVFRPARPRAYTVTLDYRGAVWLDGRYCVLAELADVIMINRELDPEHVQKIVVNGALLSDQEAMRLDLVAMGVPEGALRFERAAD